MIFTVVLAHTPISHIIYHYQVLLNIVYVLLTLFHRSVPYDVIHISIIYRFVSS